MRVGIIALLHESNTFSSQRTLLRSFEEDLLVSGEAVRERLAPAYHEVGGFFEGLAREGIEAVPVFAARALPSGVIAAETFDRLLEAMLAALDGAGPLDGVLAAPHGATVSEVHRDADGYWLGLMRDRVGPRVPIVATIDPHANLSPRMVDATDAIIAYRTNPHVDQRQRGVDAAALMARTLRGEVRPTQAAVLPPLAIGIERQSTSEPPLAEILQAADEARRRAHVLACSIVIGFPYADVAEMGSSAVVVTTGAPHLARAIATDLAGLLWARRGELTGSFTGIEAALDRAAMLEGPVCLLDMGDNVGGGAPGDGTRLAHEICRRRLSPALVCLFDPGSVREVETAGPGRRVRLRAGGKTDGLHGEPLEDDFTVVGLHDGRFEESEPRHGGFTAFDQGRSAVVRSDGGLTLLLTSRRMAPFSLHQLASCGLDPAAFRCIVAKGVHAPLAAYAPVCRHFIRVDTPGITAADMTRLEYHHRRRPMFPFERDAAWATP